MRRRTALVAVLTVVCASNGAPALANPYTDVLHAYQAYGSIPPCRFPSAELAAALRGVDTYGQQYFADFSDAVQTALAARAAGACAPAARHTSGPTSGPQAPVPAAATAATDAGAPLPILFLAGLTLLLAFGAGIAALAWSRGWEPGWAAAWRHAWAELEYRGAGRLAELADWWRSRRG